MAKTRPFDAAEYLDSPEAIAAYLSEAFETNDAGFITEAIGTVARARGGARKAPSDIPRRGRPRLPSTVPISRATRYRRKRPEEQSK